MKNYISIVILLFGYLGWSQEYNKVLQNKKILEDKDINFAEKVFENYQLLLNMNFSNSECVEFISDKVKRIDSLTSHSFFPKTPEQVQNLKSKGIETVETLFKIRELLRSRLATLNEHRKLNFNCLQSIKASIRYIRFMEEMLMEWLVENKVVTSLSNRTLEGTSPELIIANQFSAYKSEKVLQNKIKPGDLFLIRGKSYVSAMIARIGDAEMQFSHLAMVGLNPTNELVIVEALIPYGVKVSPLNTWLKQLEARIIHYRFEDEKVAEQAAREAVIMAQEYLDKNKMPIPYDFKMNAQDQNQIFCAELIENSFLKGSGYKVMLPQHKSFATKFKSTVFLKNMGIESDQLFSPGDIEFDTRFVLVQEFRFLGKEREEDQYTLLRKIRMQDAVIQSIYNWMIVENYQFVNNYFIFVKTIVAKGLRHLGMFQDKFPKHISFNTLKTIIQFEDTAKSLEEPLFQYEENFYKSQGHSLHFQEMLLFLNKFKAKVCGNSEFKLNQLFKPLHCQMSF